MIVTVTGVTGFIGHRLLGRLRGEAHQTRVLSRTVGKAGAVWPWDAMAGTPPPDALEAADAVIHLAGEPVAQRWSPEVKQRIRDSRIEGTRNLVTAMGSLRKPPRVLVAASALGYYGERGDDLLTEASSPGTGFLPEVCIEWERQADRAAEFGVRVVKIRIGIVLGSEGGALKKMLLPFRLGVGGRVGSGRQWMSWIHADDLVSLMLFALDTPGLHGAVNGTAPNPVTNAEFTRVLGAVLHRPAILPVPAFALKIMFGEMAEVMLGSQRIQPAAALSAGFQFRYPALEQALRQLL